MKLTVWLTLLLFVGCLAAGCGGQDSTPTRTSSVPAKSELSSLPKRTPLKR